MNIPSSPTARKLSIKALIIGGNVGGLATAIAFRRAGHEAFVFETRNTITPEVTGGIRLPPNVTKILYHWGYERRLKKFARTSSAADITHMATGERIGRHVWEEELIRDAQGDFVFMQHGEFIHFLHTIAEELGVILKYGSRVSQVDLNEKVIKLETGQTFKGDIIVGADGADGISRSLFVSQETKEPVANVYSTSISEELVRSDSLTATLYDPNQTILKAWFGYECAALGWPMGTRLEYALVIYGPPGGQTTGWLRPGGKEPMLELFANAEPRLRKLGVWARDPHVVPVNKVSPLSDWCHINGSLVLVGHAAQPLPAGSVQDAAIAFEDGVALGRIFSHLKRHDEIALFLMAYEDIRRERDIRTYEREIGDLAYLAMPREEVELCNSLVKQGSEASFDILGFDIPTGGGSSDDWDRWHLIVDQFAYNAEDAADDWWQTEGKIIELSRGGTIDGPIQVLVAQNISEY